MSFNGREFIDQMGMRLVQEFAFSAGATHPGLIGSAKEHPARIQLEKTMPQGVSVGSGIVVDSYGGISRQQDIVVYESICPIFSYNDTPEATFYPVEGVIACGEVKSTFGKSELVDAFVKSQSVKRLRRHAVKTDDGLGLEPTVSFRNYGSLNCFAAAKVEEFDQTVKSLDQIFTFVLCEKFESSPQTTIVNAAAQFKEVGREFGPNFICSLRDGFILPFMSSANSVARAVIDADSILLCEQAKDSFPQLLAALRRYVRSGRTVDRAHFERYFGAANMPISVSQVIKV